MVPDRDTHGQGWQENEQRDMHSVREDYTESFKVEWEAKHAAKYALVKDESVADSYAAPAVEHKAEGRE